MGKLVIHVALISETDSIGFDEVAIVAAALNKQAARDFEPIWCIDATVDAFARLEDMPVGYWPMIIRDDIQAPGAAGYHSDDNGQPFALIQSDTNWSLTASHELVEMLADPLGSRLTPGPSPMQGQGRVEFLVEVGDPCEAETYAYTVNDVVVSDFYTPNYFDPTDSQGVRYDFTGNLSHPREVLPGGYLSWHEPATDHWWQETYFGASPEFRDLGVFTASANLTLREWIDSQTREPYERLEGLYQAQSRGLKRQMMRPGASALTSKPRVQQLRKLIASLTRRGGSSGGGGRASGGGGGGSAGGGTTGSGASASAAKRGRRKARGGG
jgi:hypothetical protein